MNRGLKILLLHCIMISCASTPKPTVKKKVGTAAPAAKTVKGSAPVTPATPSPVEEEEVHEEEDDQYSRMKKYYKK